MKTFWKTILVFSVFLALSGVAYADDGDRDGGLEFEALMTGAQEVPERESPALGKIEAEFNKGFTELDVDLRVSTNTVGEVRAAHFHCARAGENGPIVFGLFSPGRFPVSNIVDGTLTNADYTGADCVPTTGRVINNLASLAFAMREGLIYANFHTSVFPGGEVRGQMIEVKKKHDFHRDHSR
jgi:hypothetical protein